MPLPPRNDEYFTLVFKGDIGKFKQNPMVTDTPFGRPVAAGRGDAFEEADRLRSMIHSSDCAIHNAPALAAGPGDCGAVNAEDR